jgi:hypothetical protein
MRMRQSFAQFERAFLEETHLDRYRRQSLARATAQRSRRRHVERETKRSSLRFAALALTLVLTAVAVTFVMFRVLYLALS